MSGITTSIWLKISGGVMMAEITSRITMVYFRFFVSQEGDIKPVLEKKNTNTGNSNTMPTDSDTETTVLMYELNETLFATASLT